MTDREIELAMDKLIGSVWDEGKCRVCGRMMHPLDCATARCRIANKFGKRADDPLPHTTSWEQIAKDREMLAEDKRGHFCHELIKLVQKGDDTAFDTDWLLVNATPRQQCIAVLRAHGGRIEE